MITDRGAAYPASTTTQSGEIVISPHHNVSGTEHLVLAEMLHWRLFRIAVAMRRQEYDQFATNELTLTQCSVLYVLQKYRRVRMSELAAHERVTLPTMTKAVRRLKELGMVRRQRDTSDHRNIWIEITAKGVQTQRAAVAELLDTIVTELSPSEIQALDAALEPLERLAADSDRRMQRMSTPSPTT